MKPVLAMMFVGASLVACSSGDRSVAISPGVGEAVESATSLAPASTSDFEPVQPGTTNAAVNASTTSGPASTAAAMPVEPAVIVADDLGPALDRVVLAEYGVGDGPRDLGIEACTECGPVRPAAPILTGPDVGDLIIADVLNGRWQTVRAGVWGSVPFAAGERIVGTPIQGTDGYVYAVVDAGGERRADALSPFDLSWAASYPLPTDGPGALHQVNEQILYGDTLVTTVQRRPELPTWSLDLVANRLTLTVADIERVFELPPTWEMSSSSIAHVDDGTVVAHATVPNREAPPTSLLVRFWLDGSHATGTIEAPSVAADGAGRLAEAGWVQLDDAISLYAFPEYDGPDPLAGWVAPPIVTPDPESVPRLLPVDVAGAPSEWLRSESRSQDPAPARRYVQVWAQAGEDAVVTGLVEVRTGFTSEPFNPSSTPVDVAGWSIARSSRVGSDDFAHIVLQHADRFVSVWSVGLGEAATVQIANRLVIDGDREGWAPPFAADEPWVSIVEGWEANYHGRGLTGSTSAGRRFELAISRSLPSAALTPFAIDRPIILADIGGRPALVFDRGDVVGLSYAPAPDIVVTVGAESTVDELVAVAEGLAEVDVATWETLTTPNPSTEDGCNSFFC